MKKTRTFYAVITLVLIISSISNAGVITIATFEDPSLNASFPLFTIDSVGGTINGKWEDSQTGLNLNVPSAGNIYYDAWFEMTELTYSGGTSGITSGGTVTFYENGGMNQVLTIGFDKATLVLGGLASQELLFGGAITITGIDFTVPLTEPAFGFTFANHVAIQDGFTATAAFTSSAVIPEPATMALLGLGGLLLRRRKRA